MQDLDDNEALCKPEGLGMFAAGLASAIAVANFQWITWFIALSSLPGSTVSHLVASVRMGKFWPILELLLIMDGPALLLASALFAGFACTVMWRAGLGAAASGGRVRVIRHALPWTVGFLLGEPMSIIYAMSDSWGVLDRSLAWEAADLAVSALIILLLATLMFRWAAESAAVWIPKTPSSLRRRHILTIAVGVLGILPALFPWLLFHGTQAITQTVYFVPDRQIATWPLSDSLLTNYAPAGFTNAVPAALLLIALPTLFVFAGSLRPALDHPPKWLPSDLTPESWEHLRGPTHAPDTRSPLKPGVLGALVSFMLGFGYMLTLRTVVGPAKMHDEFGTTSEMYMYNALIELTSIVCASFAVVSTRRNRRTQLSSILVIVFIATVLASPLLTGAVFAAGCGGSAWTCFVSNPQQGMEIYGKIATGAPLYGAITAVLFWWTISLIRKRRAFVVAEAADSESAAPDTRFRRTVALVVILIGLTCASYVAARYLTFAKADFKIDNLSDIY